MPPSPLLTPAVLSLKPAADTDLPRSHQDQVTPSLVPTLAAHSHPLQTLSYPSSSSSDDGNDQPSDYPADIIDMETFRQILDLDEDDTYEFSKGMAYAYFSQAEQTFDEMDQALCVAPICCLAYSHVRAR